MKKSILIGAGVLTLSLGIIGATYSAHNVNAYYDTNSSISVNGEGDHEEAISVVNNMKNPMLAVASFVCENKIVSPSGSMYRPYSDVFLEGVTTHCVNYNQDLIKCEETNDAYLVDDSISTFANLCMSGRNVFPEDFDDQSLFQKDETNNYYIVPKIEKNYDISIKSIDIDIRESSKDEYPYYYKKIYNVVADVTKKDGNSIQFDFTIDASELFSLNNVESASSDASESKYLGRISDAHCDEGELYQKF